MNFSLSYRQEIAEGSDLNGLEKIPTDRSWQNQVETIERRVVLSKT